MKILVACEYSGIVRDAFCLRGHDAYSCDIIESESELTNLKKKHICDDVFNHLNNNWDMLIAHPPCRFISYAGIAHWNNAGRVFDRLDALRFFALLWAAPIEKICIENPMGCASPTISKYSQIIHPYFFGDAAIKKTCLWLKGLPLLQHTKKDDLFSLASACDRPLPLSIDNTARQKKRYFTDGHSRDQKKG